MKIQLHWKLQEMTGYYCNQETSNFLHSWTETSAPFSLSHIPLHLYPPKICHWHMSTALQPAALHITLHCTALYSTSLYYIAQYCAGLYSTVLYCTALHCTALHCTALHCTALHCTALHCTALHCTALHCTALHCTALANPASVTKTNWPTWGQLRPLCNIDKCLNLVKFIYLV